MHPSAHVPFTVSADIARTISNNGKYNTEMFLKKDWSWKWFPHVVRTIKQQPNHPGWRWQTSATLSLRASENRSKLLPQNGFTYTRSGPITYCVVLTVQEKEKKSENPEMIILIA